MLDHADDFIRRWDLFGLYAYMLLKDGKVNEVKEIRPNMYEVSVTYKKYDSHSGVPVVYYQTKKIILRPVIDG